MKIKKIFNLNLLLGISLIISFYACGGKQDFPITENIIFQQVYVPVIQGKTTTIAKLDFKTEQQEMLNGLEIELQADIDIMSLSIDLLLEDGTKESLQGTFHKEEKSWSLMEERSLPAGNLVMNINVALAENADLQGRFSLQVPMIEISGEKVKPSGQQENLAYRIGKSLRTEGDDGVAAFRIPGLAIRSRHK